MALNQSNPTQLNALFALFSNTQVQEEYQNDPYGWLQGYDLHDSSPQDITNAVNQLSTQNTFNNQTAIDNNVESNIDVDQGSLGQTALGVLGGGGVAGAPVFAAVPPPPPPAPAGVNAAQYSLDYYIQQHTSVQDNDTSIVNDNDTTVDGSINQTVLANGDVDQTFDNDITTASGAGAVAAGDDAEGVATGDGAVAAGDDIEDSAINTGVFEGTQVGGDNEGDIQTITGNVSGTVIGEIDESNVNFGDEAIVGADDIGAASFGNGDATSFGEDNDFDNVATGSGDVFDIDADGGSSGQGGNVNIGGNQSVNQSVNTDNSTNDSFNQDNDVTTTNTDSFNTDASTNDSFNTDFNTEVTTTTTDSFNTDNSVDNTDSFNTDVEANTTVDTDTTVDIDAELDQTTQTTTIEDSFDDAEVEDVEIDTED